MIDSYNSCRYRILINMIPIFALIVYYYTPSIGVSISIVVPLFVMMVWISHSIFCIDGRFWYCETIAKLWILFFMYVSIMSIIGYSSTNMNFQLSILGKYIIPLIGVFVLKNYNRKEQMVLLSFGLLVILANVIQNFVLWVNMPILFADEKEHTEEMIGFKNLMNVGTTSFVAICMFMVGTLFVILKNVDKKSIRMGALFFICIFLYYVVFINVRGTTTILLAIMALGMFFANFEPSNNRKSYYIVSLLLFFVISFAFIVPVLLWVAKTLDNDLLLKRFSDIESLFEASGNINQMEEGSFSARIELSMLSLNSWMSNPLSLLIGIGDHTQGFGGDLLKSGIGGHSEFCDCLGRYGLIGGILYYKILSCHYYNLVKFARNRKVIKYLNIVFVVIVLYGFINNLFEPITQVFTFVLFPLMIKLLTINNKSYDKNRILPNIS